MRTPSPNWMPQPYRKAILEFAGGGALVTAANTTEDKILTIECADYSCVAMDPADQVEVVLSVGTATSGGEAPIHAKQLDQDVNNQCFGLYRGVIPLFPGDGFTVNVFAIAGPADFNCGVLITGFWTPYLDGLPAP